MPTTKLSQLTENIKRLKKYRNPDERCTYFWQLDLIDYCWGYATFINHKNKWKGGIDWGDWYKVQDYETFRKKFCIDCDLWKEKH